MGVKALNIPKPLTQQDICNELLNIEMDCRVMAASLTRLQNRATGLRKKLEGVVSSASPSGLSADQIAKVIAKRESSITKIRYKKHHQTNMP